MPNKSFGYYNYIIISRRDKDARSRAWAFVILGDFGSKRRNSANGYWIGFVLAVDGCLVSSPLKQRVRLAKLELYWALAHPLH